MREILGSDTCEYGSCDRVPDKFVEWGVPDIWIGYCNPHATWVLQHTEAFSAYGIALEKYILRGEERGLIAMREKLGEPWTSTEL